MISNEEDQSRLNCCVLHHVHQDKTNELDLHTIAKEFVQINECSTIWKVLMYTLLLLLLSLFLLLLLLLFFKSSIIAALHRTADLVFCPPNIFHLPTPLPIHTSVAWPWYIGTDSVSTQLRLKTFNTTLMFLSSRSSSFFPRLMGDLSHSSPRSVHTDSFRIFSITHSLAITSPIFCRLYLMLFPTYLFP